MAALFLSHDRDACNSTFLISLPYRFATFVHNLIGA